MILLARLPQVYSTSDDVSMAHSNAPMNMEISVTHAAPSGQLERVAEEGGQVQPGVDGTGRRQADRPTVEEGESRARSHVLTGP